MEHIFTLFTLVALQAVLGFDNLLYISLESKRAPEGSQATVRKIGIGLAVLLRIVLLFAVLKMVELLDRPLFAFEGAWVSGSFRFDAVIFLLGGLFILYTAIKEIWHLIAAEVHEGPEREPTAPWKVVAMIVIMNLVFSFDSILSAMALSDTFWVLATAIVIGGVLMIVLADRIAVFIEKNRMYEVLGLFILFLVGVLLISEGGHKAQLAFFGNEIHAMSKATFYFVLAALVVVDVIQGKYQKKLIARQRALVEAAARPA
jgi:predicted tellurium resistance membrane protein TerC